MSKTNRFLWIICLLGVVAHLYDLLRHSHSHDRAWDITMHVSWVCILLSTMVGMRKTAQ